MNSVRVGFDYSLSCPAMAVVHSNRTEFHFCIANKKLWTTFSAETMSFVGHSYPIYKTNAERFDKISEIFINELKSLTLESCQIENYAFAANGRITDIAESTGVMKHKLHRLGIHVEALAPGTIKKFACSRGNAKKDEMYREWLNRKLPDLFTVFGIKENLIKIPGPINDIVDAYFVAMCQVPQNRPM